MTAELARAAPATMHDARAAAADPPDLLTVAEVARLLRRPEPTLRYWRYLGTGPRSFKMRGRVFYRRTEVDTWLAAQERGAVGEVSA